MVAVLLLSGFAAYAGQVERELDRIVVAYQESPQGPEKVVLVKESAFLADKSGKYHDDVSAYNFSRKVMFPAFDQMVKGGRCAITGEVIPPMTPKQAAYEREKVIQSLLLVDNVYSGLPSAEAKRVAGAIADELLPELGKAAAKARHQ